MYEDLLYENESATLDFKREQYRFNNENDFIKSELLKDILAFANAWRRTDAHILIGVQENKDTKALTLGINEDLDDAQIQQFFNEKTQIPINFTYKTIILEHKKVGVIEITHTKRPVFLKKDYGKLKKNVVYIRRGSSTTEASPDEIFDMGKKDSENTSTPTLNINFSNNEEKTIQGDTIELDAIDIGSSIYKNISDFDGDHDNSYFGDQYRVILNIGTPNREYYRKLFLHYHVKKKINKLNFSIANTSPIVATGISILLIAKKTEECSFIKNKDIPQKIEKYHNHLTAIIKTQATINTKKLMQKIEPLIIEETSQEWHITMNIEKILPKSIIYFEEPIFLLSNKSHSSTLSATIYGDNIPLPIKKDLLINCNVKHEKFSLNDVILLDEEHNKSF
ncbi:ATP-binding protein [Thiothrix unzii]|jgi:hypothetical protein|uniref:AlbA family DNA-binding domain-containing protein n=1 Tax=Thiothrix unzii TaxID=111769 RepID=UPI002A36E877|nr:ATP-binding protein [Thiothrix unzii]MDX9990401.1 ATP-binding protein [Thiothrix unzii]